MHINTFDSSTQPISARILHTMVRVKDLDSSIAFYTNLLGMKLFRKEQYPSGRFTLAFLGYGEEFSGATIELTHNWDKETYEHGSAFGHIALAVNDIHTMCERLEKQGVKILRAAGPMTFISPDRSESEIIAFIRDPDGYRIELIEQAIS